MKYRSPNERDRIVDEINQENTAALLNPFKVIGYSLVLGPLAVGVILKYKVAIDTFAFKHPVVMGILLIALALVGMVLLVKKMLW